MGRLGVSVPQGSWSLRFAVAGVVALLLTGVLLTASAPAYAVPPDVPGSGNIEGRWFCKWDTGGNSVLRCYDRLRLSEWDCSPVGDAWICRQMGGAAAEPGDQDAVEDALGRNPSDIPPRPGSAAAVEIRPTEQRAPQLTPGSTCEGRYTVVVRQDPTRSTTLHMAFGDGSSRVFTVPQGTGWIQFDFSHVFTSLFTDAAGYDPIAVQKATVLETSYAALSVTRHA